MQINGLDFSCSNFWIKKTWSRFFLGGKRIYFESLIPWVWAKEALIKLYLHSVKPGKFNSTSVSMLIKVGKIWCWRKTPSNAWAFRAFSWFGRFHFVIWILGLQWGITGNFALIRHLSGIHQSFIRHSSGIFLAFFRQFSVSLLQAVVGQSSGSCQEVIIHSSFSHQAVIRQSSRNHQAVIRQSQAVIR